jgi:antitoxin component YwqK of YwqJK toxin-antitoxin module
MNGSNRRLLWGAALLTMAVGSAASADGERKILRKEEVSPSSGHVFRRYEYYVDARGSEIKHGLETWWDKHGKKTRDVFYVDGLQHGPDITWDTLGSVAERGQWKKGAREGKWECLHSDGTVYKLETYSRGLHVGSLKFWNSQRVLTYEEHFNDRGELLKVESFYDDGSKRKLGTFNQNRRDGTWTYWTQTGKVAAEGVWKDGKPFSGVCGVPDTGSSGLETFGRYQDGTFVEKVKVEGIGLTGG